MDKTYSAKLLLLGEHTILRGSRALATPFPSRYCQWILEEGAPDSGLEALASYLVKQLPLAFALERMQEELAMGWRLASTIPVGYGLGSSGAVCVAVFDRYATAAGRAAAATDPKAFFATMENHFHGNSSGTDPLITYLGETVCLHGDGRYEVVKLPIWPADRQLFLLDTQKARQTAPLVQFFLDQYETQEDFRQAVDAEWIPATESGIDAWQAADWSALAKAFSAISTFQLTHLEPMVLMTLRKLWQQGLERDLFQLKVCGAGGGGYCLGLTQDWEATKQVLDAWPCELLMI